VGQRASLLVALPSYDGRRHNARAMADILQIRNLDVRTLELQSSLLTLGFNRAWATALNANPDFFLMLHEDICPVQDDWVQTMFMELATNKAGVLSVVSPIKTPDGLTSTALDTDPWNPRRLTLADVFKRPETWTEPGLLLNTGLMLVDFRQPWVRGICFTINDRIVRKPDGSFAAEVQPEDWNFSRDAARAGARLYATRKVVIQHVGRAGYDNSCVWGEHATDPDAPQEATP
jgi:GT2 family glycosyltransferase